MRRISAFVALFSMVIGAAAHAAPANVVYGNLGAFGTDALGSTNTDIGPGAASIAALAQGFTTGTGNLALQSVTLGAFASSSGGVSRTVSIYSSVSNAPGTSLYTSASTLVGLGDRYEFPFSGVTLSPNTNYWIVPDSTVDWSWYLNSAETDPVEQNSSGYAYLGTKKINQATSTWVNSILPYSVSVQAVPEPSTVVVAGLGILAAGVMQWRRRKGA
jgi:PEP-CTERM motif